MIYEVYIIDFNSGIPYIDKTYRKIHLGVSNTLLSGLIHVVYTAFKTEMEIGNIRSMTTQDYKLIYLKYQKLLFVTLADIKLEETKIQTMLNQLASSFYEKFKDILANWSQDLTVFGSFIPKMDSIVIDTITGLFFIEKYPRNIVSIVDYIGKNYSLEYQDSIGRALAEKILSNRYSNIVKKRNLKKELSRITVIKDFNDDFIELSVCPFCREKQTEAPVCNFITGFIKGMLQSDVWVEKTCVSCGDNYCSFSKKA